jgi:hypothetical protein
MAPSRPLIMPQQVDNTKLSTLFKRNIGNVWYQQDNKKLRNQALIYGRTEGEIYVSRGENVHVFKQ